MPSDSAAFLPFPAQRRMQVKPLVLLALLAVIAVGLFLTLGVPAGAWEFALSFRAGKLAGLILVAFAIATSTQLFHAATRNQILTPSIMGFDALYLMIQTSLVFGMGAMATLDIDPVVKFTAEVLVMMGFSTALFLWLFTARSRDLHLLVLVGIIFGTLFRSLSNFISRMIDPNEFVVVQGAMFARFNAVNIDLLWISIGLTALTLPVLWHMRHQFDVLALGRETAIGLGLRYRRVMFAAFGMIGLLVSVSTALVGPVTFFGLLVVHLAYRILPGARFAPTLLASSLIAIITLVGGQAIYEHVLGLQGTLSVVIDALGGITFLYLLLKGVRR
ncbi:iron chelate uptake ABC transporter family permease subunit [Celeribacter sp. PS-C1]|uniref:iron chelate uptake ABC transporter family permease subunit n=1 Tax=Celeribacter sp. PS-C1 TaxID=2820813 RepID=UPI001CA59414|nr:iron chelate uptake ABC transporter family permease subunit [Celeribacter sp. PS-C1]MBW6416318.1 iron chelate uptake ABC transporter family permease subunit [Celeribacter sp. PS-C1]